MRHLRLTEWQTSTAVELTVDQRDILGGIATIRPTAGVTDRYDVTPGSHVGAIEVGDLSVVISPKIPITKVMFVISYALGRADWRQAGFDFDEDRSMVEAVVPGFVHQVAGAFRRGVLQGYRGEEDRISTVRGRIRFPEQIRRSFGIAPPIEVEFDEFTEDIDPNRLLKAAIHRLGRLRIRSASSRQALRSFDQLLANVSDVDYGRHLPEVVWTRLNRHYRPAVELARLILRSTAWELNTGRVRSSGFLIDMNQVFEDFVVVALSEALGGGAGEFRHGDRSLRLDVGREVKLEPDLSLWRGGRCLFVGDAKYKQTRVTGINHPDLYQLLAYCVAADLPGGLLVYAAGEADQVVHEVVHLGRRLQIATVDLEGDPDQILERIQLIARRIERLARSCTTAATHNNRAEGLPLGRVSTDESREGQGR